MKYLIYGPLETYIIFPDHINHKEMEETLGVKSISAGFCHSKGFKVRGESLSLGIKSREEDQEILNREEL